MVCGAAWHAEKPSCVDSKRPRVYWHHTHMCHHMCAWCRYTRGRIESTHEGFLDRHTGERRGEEGERREGHRQFCSPKFAHKFARASERFTERNPWFLPIQGLRTGREQHVPASSNHSLYLMKLLRDTPTHPPTTTPLPSLPFSFPHAHAHANANVHASVYVHARVFVYVRVYAYVDVYVHVCVCVCFCPTRGPGPTPCATPAWGAWSLPTTSHPSQLLLYTYRFRSHFSVVDMYSLHPR